MLFKFCFSWLRYNYTRVSRLTKNRLLIERNAQVPKIALNYLFLFQSSYWRPRIVSVLSIKFKLFFVMIILLFTVVYTYPNPLYYVWFFIDFLWFNFIYWVYFLSILLSHYLIYTYNIWGYGKAKGDGAFGLSSPATYKKVSLREYSFFYNLVSLHTKYDNGTALTNYTSATLWKAILNLRYNFLISRNLVNYNVSTLTFNIADPLLLTNPALIHKKTYLNLLLLGLTKDNALVHNSSIFINPASVNNFFSETPLTFNLMGFQNYLKSNRWDKVFYPVSNRDIRWLNYLSGMRYKNELGSSNQTLSVLESIWFPTNRIRTLNTLFNYWGVTSLKTSTPVLQDISSSRTLHYAPDNSWNQLTAISKNLLNLSQRQPTTILNITSNFDNTLNHMNLKLLLLTNLSYESTQNSYFFSLFYWSTTILSDFNFLKNSTALFFI